MPMEIRLVKVVQAGLEMENYDANGNKIGESRPDCFGNMNHYNENGHKTGHSDKGIFGGWNHFDE